MRLPLRLIPADIIRALLDAFEEGVLLVSPTGRIVASNTQAHQLTALAREELLGAKLSALFPPQERQNERWHFRNRYGRHIPMWVNETKIGVAHRLIRFHHWEQVAQQEHRLAFQQRIAAALNRLLDLTLYPPEEFALRLALEEILGASNAQWVALYGLEEPQWQLRVGSGKLPDLPWQIPLDEGPPPSWLETQLWSARNRHRVPETGLGRIIRAQPYLYTLPLGSDQGLTGLLLVAFNQRPAPWLRTALLLFATVLDKWHQGYQKLHRIRQQSEQWREQAALGERLWRSYPFPALITDAQGTILQANHHLQDVLGYHADEVRGLPLDQVLICQGETSLKEYLHQALHPTANPAAPPAVEDTLILRRNGQAFPASIHFFPYLTEDTPRVVVVIEDRTPHFETRALQRQATLGVFLASYAHEVRNPLNNLSTGLDYLDIALDNPNEREALRETIQRMRRDLERLEQMAERLLQYARPNHPEAKGPLQVSAIVDDLLQRWQPRLTKYGIEVHRQYDANLPPLCADSVTLEQIFANLIDNAIQALKQQAPPREIFIRIEKHPRHLEVVIADNGPGIPEEIQQRVFDPFFTTRQDGHGIGLALVRKMVTDYQGAIRLESFPGQGTIFRLTFPLSPTPCPRS